LDNQTIITLVITLVVAIIAASPGILSLYRQGKKDKEDIAIQKQKLAEEEDKNNIDAAALIRDSALSLVKPLKDKIEELKLELVKVTEQLKSLEDMLNQKDELIRSLEKEVNTLKCEAQGLIERIDNLISENSRLKEMIDNFIKSGK